MTGRRAITLVAWREIRERLRSKTFLASTLLILALVGGSALVGRFANAEKTYMVAATRTDAARARGQLQRAAQPFDEAKVRLRVVDSAAAGRQVLEDEQVDALLLLSDDRLLSETTSTRRPPRLPTRRCARSATSCHRHRSDRGGTLHPPEKESDDATTLVAFASGILLFTSLAFYGQWVAGGSWRRRTTASSR